MDWNLHFYSLSDEFECVEAYPRVVSSLSSDKSFHFKWRLFFYSVLHFCCDINFVSFHSFFLRNNFHFFLKIQKKFPFVSKYDLTTPLSLSPSPSLPLPRFHDWPGYNYRVNFVADSKLLYPYNRVISFCFWMNFFLLNSPLNQFLGKKVIKFFTLYLSLRKISLFLIV